MYTSNFDNAGNLRSHSIHGEVSVDQHQRHVLLQIVYTRSSVWKVKVLIDEIFMSGQHDETSPYQIVQSVVQVLQTIQQAQSPPAAQKLVGHVRQLKRTPHKVPYVLSETHRAYGHNRRFVLVGEHIKSFLKEQFQYDEIKVGLVVAQKLLQRRRIERNFGGKVSTVPNQRQFLPKRHIFKCKLVEIIADWKIKCKILIFN